MAVVAVRGLEKAYGPRRAVDRLDFDVPEGTVFGLLGPNGAGKTTTIRVLLGLVRPTGGDISLLGTQLGRAGYHSSLRRVGAMIEEPSLYRALSGRRNLEVHARYLKVPDAKVRIDEVLGFVGLGERGGDRVKRYSQGMRQRLGLGIALLGRPDLVILDEPTNGLDPAGIVEMRELIRSLPSQGTTVMLSSHLLAEVQLACDHVAIVDHGRLITTGATQDVISAHAAAAMFTVQVLPEDDAAAVAALTAAGLRAASNGAGLMNVDGAGITGRHISHALGSVGVWPEAILRSQASLEDVFLSLTGAPSTGAGGMRSVEEGGSGAAG